MVYRLKMSLFCDFTYKSSCSKIDFNYKINVILQKTF